MQTFKQTRQILHFSEDLHRELSEFYHRVSDHAQRRRVKMLLDYLSRHEEGLRACLEGYSKLLPQSALDTWFQYVPDTGALSHLEALAIAPDMSVEDVIAVVLQLDDALISFYRELAENAESAEVRELFEGLLSMEVHEEIALKREGFTT